jgi:hypothetical protein
MDGWTLRTALSFGGSTRFNDRGGQGRFGMGLPNSSVSQAGRLDLYSWQRGKTPVYCYLDVDQIAAGQMTEVPATCRRPSYRLPTVKSDGPDFYNWRYNSDGMVECDGLTPPIHFTVGCTSRCAKTAPTPSRLPWNACCCRQLGPRWPWHANAAPAPSPPTAGEHGVMPWQSSWVCEYGVLERTFRLPRPAF